MYPWYVWPEEQADKIRKMGWDRIWKIKEIPDVPVGKLKEGEVHLLCFSLPDCKGRSGLSRTVDELWHTFAPEGLYTKWRYDSLKAKRGALRQAPDTTPFSPGLRWVAFNPTTYVGKSPKKAREEAKRVGQELAGAEVLMANLMFPSWSMKWGEEGCHYPWLSGLLVRNMASWNLTPFMHRFDDGRKRIDFGSDESRTTLSHLCSPTVRML